jgi:transposase
MKKFRKILNRKGDLKSKEIVKKQTNLTVILNFMFKNFNKNFNISETNSILSENLTIKLNNKENWLIYINQIKNNENIKKEIKEFYVKIETFLLTKNDDFINRIFNLLENKNYNLFQKYWKKSIIINSFSFKTQSRINKQIIDSNKNNNSIISHFINLGGFNRNNLSIPIKFHSNYHSLNDNRNNLSIPIKFHSNYHSLNDNRKTNYHYLNDNSESFQRNSNTFIKDNNENKDNDKYGLKNYKQTYNITFDKIHNKFKRIELCFDDELIINNKINNNNELNNNNEDLLGIDLNTKNNIFYTSNNTNYKLNSKTINSFINLMKKVDKKKTESIYLKKQKDKQRKSLTYEINKLISLLIKDSEILNKNHLILEDIRIVGNSLKVKNKEYDLGYGRMISFLNMDTIKHKIRNICHKRNMKVSFVPSHYTSKKCSHCHYISDNNRKSQEVFICEHCGLEINADYNASLNIKQILSLDVLKNEFLVFDDIFNEYNVKKYLSKLKIKAVYLKLFEDFNNIIKSA